MKRHLDYARVEEALADDETRECILYIRGEQANNNVIGVDEAVLRAAVELHPGADRELLQAFFTFTPGPPSEAEFLLATTTRYEEVAGYFGEDSEAACGFRAAILALRERLRVIGARAA